MCGSLLLSDSFPAFQFCFYLFSLSVGLGEKILVLGKEEDSYNIIRDAPGRGLCPQANTCSFSAELHKQSISIFFFFNKANKMQISSANVEVLF